MLKIIHTADWHLGHTLHGISRDYEHQCFLQWLSEQLQIQHADALIIAGDIFDSANPSASSQSMLYDFLVQIKRHSPLLDVVIIGGNHDSAARLDAPAPILDSLGVKVLGGLTRSQSGTGTESINWQRLIVPLKDKDENIKAICGAMPFIRTADLSHLSDINDDYDDPLISGVAKLYQQLSEQMQAYKKDQALENIAQIQTGHCYMVGTELSELSERRILGGNQHALPADIFNDSMDYVALGHLHKSQQVRHKSNVPIYYSGSPLPLSFSEKNYQHKVLMIELSDDGKNKINTRVDFVQIPRAVDMKILPHQGYATLTELKGLIDKQLDTLSEDMPLAEKQYPVLEIRVELEKPEPGLRAQIETMLEDKAVRLLKISTHYPGKGESLSDSKGATRLDELHPEDVFQQCYKRRFEQGPTEQMTGLFQQLLESIREQD